MNRLLTYLLLLILASAAVGCAETNTTIPNTPFEINHQITCETLIEDGYRWMPGVDVIIIGKRTGDTLIGYQMDYQRELVDEENYFILDEEIIGEQIDIIMEEEEDVIPSPKEKTTEEIQEEFGKNPSEMCDGATVCWRIYQVRISKEVAAHYKENIDRGKFAILKSKYNSDIGYFDVVNISTKDTFSCIINEEKDSWYFEASISLRN